jgi:superfamily II RNA helicase
MKTTKKQTSKKENIMSEQMSIDTSDIGTLDLSEDTRTEAQKKAAEILANRAKGKPVPSGLAARSTANPKPPREKKVKAPKGIQGYRFLRDLDQSVDKLNRQQGVLIKAMLEHRKADGELKDVVLRKDILENVTMEDLNSRQPVERVLGFYLNLWKRTQPAILKEDGSVKKAEVPALLEVVSIVEPKAAE